MRTYWSSGCTLTLLYAEENYAAKNHAHEYKKAALWKQ